MMSQQGGQGPLRRAQHDEIYFWVEFAIATGKLDEFKGVLQETIQLLEREDVATQSFQCFLSKDGTVCHIQECYQDSQAVLDHFGFARRAGGILTKMLQFARLVRTEVHGNLTPDAEAAVARFGGVPFPYWHGFTR